MDEWFSKFLMQLGAEMYDEMQMLRGDYRAAMKTLRYKANRLIRGKAGKLDLLDVACGTGMATRTVFGDRPRLQTQDFRFVGLDSDCKLLELARTKWPSLTTRCSDMITAKIDDRFDLILCSFAYHHIVDSQKRQLCRNLRTWSKERADLVVLEICLTEDQILCYYEGVKRTLRRGRDADLCRRFLDWTMSKERNSNSEWKVSLSHLLDDFSAAGWELHEQQAVWGIPSLPPEAGCHYLHFRCPTSK